MIFEYKVKFREKYYLPGQNVPVEEEKTSVVLETPNTTLEKDNEIKPVDSKVDNSTPKAENPKNITKNTSTTKKVANAKKR